MKTLVVWYSRTGMTRRVADEIVGLTGWDRDEIVDTSDRRGLRGWLRAAWDARRRRSTSLRPAERAPSTYDLVVIGTPVWAACVSPPVATYLRMHAGHFPQVAFFATYGGSGASRVMTQLEALAGRTPLARLVVREADIRAGNHHLAVRGFVEELRDHLRTVRPATRAPERAELPS